MFIILNYVYKCVSSSGFVNMSTGIHGGERHQIPLELALKTVVKPTYLTWMPRTELGFSGKT